MKRKILLILFFCIVVIPGATCQETRKTVSENDSIKVKNYRPMKAVIMSALIPGLGQVYNKKYWKVPIVYGGLLTAAYFVNLNRVAYHDFKEAYIAEVDSDATTLNETGLEVPGLQAYMEFYRTRMEISYIALGLLYVLNIVDASVDAHLYTFDVSDDLSLRITPEFNMISNNLPYTGLRLTIKL